MQTLKAAISDVDGVLLVSPLERAWREALKDFADPDRFTTAIYEARVVGEPRLVGARAALDALGVSDSGLLTVAYAERKQKRFEELIHARGVAAFPYALRFVQAVNALGCGVLVEHEAAWASGWQCSGVEVGGDAAAQQPLRIAHG